MGTLSALIPFLGNPMLLGEEQLGCAMVMKRVSLYTPPVLPYRTTLVMVLVLATKNSLVLGHRVWTLCRALTAQAMLGWLTLMCDMANPGPDVAVTIATRHWLLVPAIPPLNPNIGCLAGMKTILLRLHI